MSDTITRRNFTVDAATVAGMLAGGSAITALADAFTTANGTHGCQTMGIGRVTVNVVFEGGAITDV